MAYYDGTGWQAEDLRQTLLVSERVLWEGRPVRLPFIVRGWRRSCFGALFLGFALLWTAGALTAIKATPDAPGMFDAVMRYAFPLFGLPFVLVGVVLTFGHFIGAAASWRDTEYMITDQRALVRTGAATPTVISVRLDRLMGTRAKGSSHGTLSFMKAGAEGSSSSPEQGPGSASRDSSALSFECVGDLATVRGIADSAIQRALREK